MFGFTLWVYSERQKESERGEWASVSVCFVPLSSFDFSIEAREWVWASIAGARQPHVRRTIAVALYRVKWILFLAFDLVVFLLCCCCAVSHIMAYSVHWMNRVSLSRSPALSLFLLSFEFLSHCCVGCTAHSHFSVHLYWEWSDCEKKTFTHTYTCIAYYQIWNVWFFRWSIRLPWSFYGHLCNAVNFFIAIKKIAIHKNERWDFQIAKIQISHHHYYRILHI